MKIRKISSIYTLDENSPDDLFITSASFENRCINVSSILSKGYSTNESLIVKYSGEYNEKYLNNIFNDLSIYSKKKIDVMELDRNDLISFWYYLEDYFKSKNRMNIISVDISTFTKSFLLILLKYLRQWSPEAKIRIFYTMAYYPKIYKNIHLSWGVDEIEFIPYLGSFRNSKNGKNILILFLGYEASRAFSIWKYIEPTRTIAIIADPPTYHGASIPTQLLNKFILTHPQTIVENVSGMNPAESFEVLKKWYEKKEFEDYLFLISPLATKMQTVGLYLFFEAYEPTIKAKIIYALPSKYNQEKYSVGYEKEKAWECILFPKAIS